MSGSEIWLQFKTFALALPDWLSALPTWLTTLLVLAIGVLIGRAIKARSVKLLEQQAARDTLRLAVDVMKLDPTLQQAPGLGQAVLAQLKAQKRLKVPPELEQVLTGGKAQATVAAVAAKTAPAEPDTGAKVEAAKTDAPPEPKTKVEDAAPPPKAEPKAAEPEPKADMMKTAAKSESEAKADKTDKAAGTKTTVFDTVDKAEPDKADAAAQTGPDKKKSAADKRQSARDKPGSLRGALAQSKE